MNKSEFQAKMNNLPAGGVVGQSAGINPTIYAMPSAQAKSDVTIGNFVWLQASDEESNILPIVAQGSSSPLGIVAHTGVYANSDMSLSASIEVPSGEFVDVIVKGDVYVSSQTTAERGNKVFANLSDGSIKTAATKTSLEGYIETSFIVNQGGEIGSLIVISNWV